jgi:hypothetical protein
MKPLTLAAASRQAFGQRHADVAAPSSANTSRLTLWSGQAGNLRGYPGIFFSDQRVMVQALLRRVAPLQVLPTLVHRP